MSTTQATTPGDPPPNSDARADLERSNPRHDEPVPDEALRERLLADCREFVEPQLIERETRLIPVVLNLIHHARPWRKVSDPRSGAAIKAGLWRVFSPGTVLATGGVATLVISLATLLLLAQQNERLDQQTYVTDAGRSGSLVSELGSVMAAVTEYAASVCVMTDKASQALRCWPDYQTPFRKEFVERYEAASASKTDRAPPKIDFFHSQMASTAESEGDRPPRLPLSPQLQGRLAVLVDALRPYRYLNFPDARPPAEKVDSLGLLSAGLAMLGGAAGGERPQLSARPASPERGLLLASLVQMGINLESGLAFSMNWEYAYIESPAFRDVWLRRRNFKHATFRCAEFAGANLESSSFRWADLHGATFMGEKTQLAAVSFRDADLTRSKFLLARLPSASNFEGADLRDVDLHEATTTEPKFLETLQAKARNFDASSWRMVGADVAPVSPGQSPQRQTFRIEHASGSQLGLAPINCR